MLTLTLRIIRMGVGMTCAIEARWSGLISSYTFTTHHVGALFVQICNNKFVLAVGCVLLGPGFPMYEFV